MNTTPTPGYEFPNDARERIEQTLRAMSNPQDQVVRSVRPERQKPVIPQEVGHFQQVGGIQQQVQQVVEGIKPVAQPEPTPVSTADYVSIDLPSKFAYYDFKDLYIKPFRNPHLAKLAKADAQSSMQLTAEVVSSVLMTPQGTQNIAFKLSMADLNAVMYWLRMNSFTKKSMSVVSQCGATEHLTKVRLGELDEESLETKTVVHDSNVEIKFLDNMPDPEVFCIRFDEPEGERVLRMRPETVVDAIQFLDHSDWMDEEFQYKARCVSYLDFEAFVPDMKWTLDQKVKFFDEMLSPDDTLLINRFAALIDDFGVKETVATKCMRCGASGVAKLSFDARSFLSPDF